MSPVTIERLDLPDSIKEPYLLLAERSDYRDYRSPAQPLPKSVAISVQTALPDYRPWLDGLVIRTAHEGSTFFTATAPPGTLGLLLADKQILRVQLAQPLAAPRAMPRNSDTPLSPPQPSFSSGEAGELLLGMVDSGCPFAHASLRSSQGTRVLSLWDQGRSLSTMPAADGFDYGCEMSRATLNALMNASKDSAGSIYEDLCYRLADYQQLAHRATHASHSLGLLAGKRLPTSAALLSQQTWPSPLALPSATADIAFVQLPPSCLACVSTAAVEHHTLDGFRHILNVALAHEHKKVVISFGYESWVGAHDGTSWFERAVDQLVVEAKLKNVDLKVFLAAGNSRGRAAHAALHLIGGSGSLKWWVPPGNEVPTFLEVWVPRDERGLKVEVSPPHQAVSLPLGTGEFFDMGAYQVVMTQEGAHDSTYQCLLIRVSPTHSWQALPTAPHGVWSLRITGARNGQSVIHAHLGRVEGDANAPRRSVQPRFVGRPEAVEEDRSRTLNGHACGLETVSCGVYYSQSFPYSVEPKLHPEVRSARGLAAEYSGAGPVGLKERPDVSMPMEEGLYHPGALSIGTRSGGFWRMSGTSTATPAAARHFADARPGSKSMTSKQADPGLGHRVVD